VLKHRETYEIMRAEDVGWGANKMVMGKHSGRAAFRSRLQELGIVLDGEEAVNAAFARLRIWPTRNTRFSTKICKHWSATRKPCK